MLQLIIIFLYNCGFVGSWAFSKCGTNSQLGEWPLTWNWNWDPSWHHRWSISWKAFFVFFTDLQFLFFLKSGTNQRSEEMDFIISKGSLIEGRDIMFWRHYWREFCVMWDLRFFNIQKLTSVIILLTCIPCCHTVHMYIAYYPKIELNPSLPPPHTHRTD